MATGDGSPTSGGTGDLVLTLDPWTETGSGPYPQGSTVIKDAAGSLRRVIGERGQALDTGNVMPGNELDVTDRRLMAVLGWMEVKLRVPLERLVLLANRGMATKTVRASTSAVHGVAASLTSQLVIPSMRGRLTLDGANDTSSGILYLRKGDAPATSASGGYSVQLNPGDYWEAKPEEVELPWTGVWSVATGFFNWSETS